ncbi:MAG: NAD(P)H-binding protein [Pseudomonadota bacterium]
MNILLCGASGFIGRHLDAALTAAGHKVIRAVRQKNSGRDIAVDYVKDTHPAAWLPRLAGIEGVINAVGVLRDHAAQPMASLHGATPRALFSACQTAGVRRVIQISALGVEDGTDIAYMRTKREADEFLKTLNLDWIILRLSLVYGEDGASARMFRLLTRLPVIALPGRGDMLVQPVHVDDISAAVVKLFEPNAVRQSIIDCAGRAPISYHDMLASYRHQQGGRYTLWLNTPWWLMRLAAKIAQNFKASPLEPQTLDMLRQGSHADTTAFSALLGRPPRDIATFINARTP